MPKSDNNSTNTVHEKNIEIYKKMASYSQKKLLCAKKLNANSEKSTNTTVSTSISGSSDSSELSNFDFDCSDSSLFFRNKMKVSDQSYKRIIFLQNNKFNRLGTFSNLKDKHKKSCKNFIDTFHYLSPSLIKPNQEINGLSNEHCSVKLSDSFNIKCLDNLCEDTEVSLNVDCADDYSENDFSDDYSFENGIKTPINNCVNNKNCSAEHYDKSAMKSNYNNVCNKINQNSIDQQTNLDKKCFGVLV